MGGGIVADGLEWPYPIGGHGNQAPRGDRVHSRHSIRRLRGGASTVGGVPLLVDSEKYCAGDHPAPWPWPSSFALALALGLALRTPIPTTDTLCLYLCL